MLQFWTFLFVVTWVVHYRQVRFLNKDITALTSALELERQENARLREDIVVFKAMAENK